MGFFFRRHAAGSFSLFNCFPPACAVGCILSPFRGSSVAEPTFRSANIPGVSFAAARLAI
jgi:hypothetical protein